MLNASIVINRSDYGQLYCLCKTLAASDSLHTLFVFDNSRHCMSKELTDNMSAILADRNKIFIYTWNNGKILPYGKCHNDAIRQTINMHLRYHLVIDDDIEITADTVDGLHLFMEKNLTVGGVIPKVIKENGSTEDICKLLPTPLDFLFRETVSRQKTGNKSRYDLQKPGCDKIMNIPYLKGYCMLLRTKAVHQAGLYDERYSDSTCNMDLTRSIHYDWLTVYLPETTVTHRQSNLSHAQQAREKLTYRIDMCRYFNKWGWIFDCGRRLINRFTLQTYKCADEVETIRSTDDK